METGSDNIDKADVVFLTGAFGCGKSTFVDLNKDTLFKDKEFAGFDSVAAPVTAALNAADPSDTQKKLLKDIANLKYFAQSNNLQNSDIDALPDNAQDRITELTEKAPDISQTDVRNALRDEIARYDGCTIIQKIRDGKSILLDSTGRPDIREGIYSLLKQNQLFDSCSFSCYNITAPCSEELAKTTVDRLLYPEDGANGKLYPAHEADKILTELYPAPICIPDRTDADKAVENCKETEETLFNEGRLKAFFVERNEARSEGFANYNITEIKPENRDQVINQHNKVTNAEPCTEVTNSLLELVKTPNPHSQSIY